MKKKIQFFDCEYINNCIIFKSLTSFRNDIFIQKYPNSNQTFYDYQLDAAVFIAQYEKCVYIVGINEITRFHLFSQKIYNYNSFLSNTHSHSSYSFNLCTDHKKLKIAYNLKKKTLTSVFVPSKYKMHPSIGPANSVKRVSMLNA